ncbi:MAG TPA: hypothetical protein VML75_27110 [Kofleriaceae bacterium]|nr:hypothetical protein [Kofleriaceae bacterium]
MLNALLKIAQDAAAGDGNPLHADKVAPIVASAPGPIAQLATLMSTRNVRVDLGWRSIESRYLGSLADTLDLVELEEEDPRAGELAQSLQIGSSGGGEVYFGLCWSDNGVCMAEIDFDEGFLTWFDSVDAFFEHVRDRELDREGEVPASVEAILEAAAAARS